MSNDNVQSIPQLKPSLHEEFSVGDRVRIKEDALGSEHNVTGGEIVGIAWTHVIFAYIVELDEPINVPEFPGKPWKCVSLLGGFLQKEDTIEECEGEYCSMESNGCHECDPDFLKFGDTSKLSETLKERNDEDYQNGDVHQSILNLGYEWWQRQGPGAHYKNMIALMEKEYGELAAFAVLIGKYNYQVCNGGHIQYFDNGYADGVGGCFDERDAKNPLHGKMVQLFENLGLNKTEVGKKVFDIICNFEVEEVYDHTESYDEEEDEYYDDYSESTSLEVVDSDVLDEEYYSINEQWMKYFNDLLKHCLT